MLPQLSESAIDDAAQPLEDLEEHRRNVVDLTKTEAALTSLRDVYGGYARAELLRRSDEVLALAATADKRRREEATAQQQMSIASVELADASGEVERLSAEQTRLGEEIRALESTELFAQGVELDELGRHVGSLATQAEDASARLVRAEDRVASAVRQVASAADDARTSEGLVSGLLEELLLSATEAGLVDAAVDLPAVPLRSVEGTDAQVPSAELDPVDILGRRASVLASVQHRGAEVEEVGRALDLVEAAERELREAEAAERRARRDEQLAIEAVEQRRRELDVAASDWRDELTRWARRLHEHASFHGLPSDDLGGMFRRPNLAAVAEQIADALRGAMAAIADHHSSAAAVLDARWEIERERLDEAQRRSDELQERTFPDPPLIRWQDRRGPALAELVDFAAGLTPGEQAGLEAAMEASGLLEAEIAADGLIIEGQLLVLPGALAEAPLSRLLVVSETVDAVESQLITRVLDGISTLESALDDPGDLTVVTTGGAFRTGRLRGRHAKSTAEHIGVTARWAALERLRQEAVEALAAARVTVEGTQGEIEAGRAAVTDLETIRRALPSDEAVRRASAATWAADQQRDEARVVVEDRSFDRSSAEAVHAELVDAARRTARNLRIPDDRHGLELVTNAIATATALLNSLQSEVRGWQRAVRAWREWGEALVSGLSEHQSARGEADAARAAHRKEATRLATLEDSLGLPYRELLDSLQVSRSDLSIAGKALIRARDRLLSATKAETNAARDLKAAVERHQADEDRCVAVLPVLRRAAEVPGLLAAARDTTAGDDPFAEDDVAGAGPLLPAVPASAAGVRRLVGALRALLDGGGASAGTAEGVRQSLRQRRDVLGAGWDAEDRQPDEMLPLAVEVTGPLGRMPLADAVVEVARQRHRSSSLLSAKQDQALRNLLQGLVAKEVAEKLHAASGLVRLMNSRLDVISTTHGIGVALRWRRRDDIAPGLATMVELLAKLPDLRTPEEDETLAAALSQQLSDGRAEQPDASYRDLITSLLDYRTWHELRIMLRRTGEPDARLGRRTALSEGEKKWVSYLALFAAVAGACDALAAIEPSVPRFILLDDAFAKVSEDNHAKLFGLLVELDLDFIATSERLWGTHAAVPELAITEVIRDAGLGVIVLEHFRWDGVGLEPA